MENADNIADLARVIQAESDAKIVLSEIIARTDIPCKWNIIEANELVNRCSIHNTYNDIRSENKCKLP